MEGPKRASDKTAIQRSVGSGMLILPWTKQILCVLWQHLRLILHVVYYSFVAVFQMFRLEVHLRITDEMGHPRVEHVSTSGSPAESLLLSSLFDGKNGVFLPGSTSLSNKRSVNPYAGGSPAGALLSSFGAEDLCLSLVDDFVIRAQDRLSEEAENFCLGHHPAWKRRGSEDWEVLVSQESQCQEETSRSTVDGLPAAKAVPDFDAVVEKDDSFCNDLDEEADLDAVVEEVDSSWDDVDEDAGGECDEEESKVLWDYFTRSADPYNPLCFSACISTSSETESEQGEEGHTSENTEPVIASCPSEEAQIFRKCPLDLVHSGTESEGDWDSPDSSSEEEVDDNNVEEENERLWELFAHPPDPYNLLNFTACASSSCHTGAVIPEEHPSLEQRAVIPMGHDSPHSFRVGFLAPFPLDSGESDRACNSKEEESVEELWNSFTQSADPYHPLHFRACLQSSPTPLDRPDSSLLPEKQGLHPPTPHKTSRPKPLLPKRHLKPHCCVQTSQEPWRLSPWKKPRITPATDLRATEKPALKKVRFSPLVQVHVIRAWSFAMQAVRKGPWEEMGRDRMRFQRRIKETEQVIGYCFCQSHREKMLEYLSHRQNVEPAVRL